MKDKIDNRKNDIRNGLIDYANNLSCANLMIEYLQIPSVKRCEREIVCADTNQDYFRVRNLISVQSDVNSDTAGIESLTQELAGNIGNGKFKFIIEFPNEKAIYVESNVSAGRINISMILEQGRLRRRLESNKDMMERSIGRQLASSATISISSAVRFQQTT